MAAEPAINGRDELVNTIARMEAAIFDAFNAHDIDRLRDGLAEGR